MIAFFGAWVVGEITMFVATTCTVITWLGTSGFPTFTFSAIFFSCYSTELFAFFTTIIVFSTIVDTCIDDTVSAIYRPARMCKTEFAIQNMV